MWNIPIFPADVINVPPRSQIRVFCIEGSESPGAIDLSSDDRLSCSPVIARAGGLTDRASKNIRIKRRNPEGKDVESEYNFGRSSRGRIRTRRSKPTMSSSSRSHFSMSEQVDFYGSRGPLGEAPRAEVHLSEYWAILVKRRKLICSAWRSRWRPWP
jgi:hypothetical protein